MNTGFVSESLVFVGCYLILNGQMSIGLTSLILGGIGGLGKFFYRVSVESTKETRKSLIYADVKSVLSNLINTAKEVSEHDSHEIRGRKGPTIH